MNDQPKRRLLRFGVFEADAATGELRKHGRRLRMASQPFEILTLLLEKPGEVVTREEIRNRLWPDGTFVDFDHSLNAAVAKLREALGDSAANPRFVETVAKRGYRFIAPVSTGHGDEPTHSSGQQTTQPESDKNPPPEPERVPRGLPRRPADRLQDLLTRPEEVPQNAAPVARVLFLLAQLMYLSFYVAALAFAGEVSDRVAAMASHSLPVMGVILTAALGVPVRLYLISGVVFRSVGMRERFLSVLFPMVLILDVLWAASPFLLAPDIHLGIALAATAALAYLPFAQRTLVLMGALNPAPGPGQSTS